jgi:hypothetical protein
MTVLFVEVVLIWPKVVDNAVEVEAPMLRDGLLLDPEGNDQHLEASHRMDC